MKTKAGELTLRPLAHTDLQPVVRLDAAHTGEEKPEYWRRVFRRFLQSPGEGVHVGVAAILEGRLVGFILGEVRAFEFGSEACGWIFSVGVDPEHARRGTASRLLAEACRRFRQAGVPKVRTMVRRNDVPVLSFFRSSGFVGGSFVQLELDMEDPGP